MKRVIAAVLSLLLLPIPVFAAGAGGETPLTRGEAAEVLYEATGRPQAPESQPFTDVTEPHLDAVGWAAEQGIVQGVGGRCFDPSAAVARQAFAVMLHRLAGSPAVSGAELKRYPDGGQTAAWAEEALIWCLKTGVLPEAAEGRLDPAGPVTAEEARQALERLKELPDLSALQKDLETLTALHRPIGSEGERAAEEYLESRFREMGYQVSLQPYTDESGREGTNVIALWPAPSADADILVFSAHHDSVPTAYGANDNASGVTALLAVADALKQVPTDTELRFISFTDEENGKKGSRFYTASLTQEERERMIGDIQLDMLGGLGTAGLSVCTTDGQANWLSDLLLEKAPGAVPGAETASDHASFQLAEVPSVLVMQDGRGYLYHSAADTAGQIDLYQLSGAVRAVAAVGREVADPQTSGYRQIARAQGAGYTYRQTRQNVIYFNSSLSDTEAYLGASGTLTDHQEREGNGWKDVYDTYLYSMRWFGGETPMNTYYCYRNGFLERIEIRPEETGYTAQQVRFMIQEMYGDPASTRTGADGVLSKGWADEIYSKYISFRSGSPCTVTVSNYSVGISNVLASYPVEGGQAAVADPEDALVWNYLCGILPAETRAKIGQFNLFTDGYSNILAYTSPMKHEDGTVDNTRFSINIDYYDVYDENGAPRDWSKLTYTILHEYGHVLLEDETQVDLSLGANTHDPAGFISGSFRRTFYDRFWKGLPGSGVGDYDQNPTHYVSRYGANYFHEDIADTFAVFVLGGQPKGDTVAEEKLRFFWNDEDMTALRSAIREKLGLPVEDTLPDGGETQEPGLPTDPDDGPREEGLTKEEISRRFTAAMTALEPEVRLDVSGMTWQFGAELDLKNIYYSVLSANRELKYAYDMEAAVSGDTAVCTFRYMPYKTGAYDAGIPQGSHAIGSLRDAKALAQSMNGGTQRLPVAITDPTLSVEDIQNALGQAGYGWIRYDLSRDGTEITAAPPVGKTLADCAAAIQESIRLGNEVLSQVLTDGMTQREQVQALYDHLTGSVAYDYRYYTDRTAMPYESTVALGALRDGLAICGGYSHAFETLLDLAGIESYTVSGSLGREGHMWNYVVLDGQGYYCDATSDRGGTGRYFLLTADELSAPGSHTWDDGFMTRLAGTAG